MGKLTLGIFGIVVVFNLNCVAQSKSEQIKQLQKIALENELRAKNAEEQAEKYNRLAQEAQRETERQRYLSLAIDIARKSLDVDDNALAGLLALQAYKYNSRFKGYDFDKDIYQGLLSALLRFESGNKKLVGHILPVRTFITKPEMSSVLAMEDDGRVLQWSIEEGEWQYKELSPTKDGFDVLGACVRQDGRLWMIGRKKRADSRVGIYDVTYSSRKIEGVHEQIAQIIFLPEANGFYALSSSGHSIFYCDSQKGSEVVRMGEKITLMDVSRDGSKLAGVTSEGNLYVWDVKKEYSRSVYKIGDIDHRVTAIAFTPTAQDIVFGNSTGEINFLATTGGSIRKTLSGHFSQIEKIAFSNLGSRMVVADKSNTLRVWNWSDVNQWPLVIKESAPIESLNFSADGSQLMVATTVNALPLHVWPLSAELMANEVCKFLTNNMTAEQWAQYVGAVPYETTCSNFPTNNR